MDEALLKLIDLLENIAPEIWAAAVMQAKVSAITNAVTITICVVFLVWFAKWISRVSNLHKPDPDDKWSDNSDWSMSETLIGICGGVTALAAIIVALASIEPLFTAVINPNFYAIQLLLGFVK